MASLFRTLGIGSTKCERKLWCLLWTIILSSILYMIISSLSLSSSLLQVPFDVDFDFSNTSYFDIAIGDSGTSASITTATTSTTSNDSTSTVVLSNNNMYTRRDHNDDDDDNINDDDNDNEIYTLNIFYNLYIPPLSTLEKKQAQYIINNNNDKNKNKNNDKNNNNNTKHPEIDPTYYWIPKTARNIIAEQIHDIGTIFLRNSRHYEYDNKRKMKQNTTRTSSTTAKNQYQFILNFNTISKEYETTGKATIDYILNELCPKYYPTIVQCIHLQHFTEGYEDVTLSSLQDYCLNKNSNSSQTMNGSQLPSDENRDSEWVMYMHSKGTFHDNPDNARLRYHMIHGTLHNGCLSLMKATSKKSTTNNNNNNNDDKTCNVCGLIFYPMWTNLFPGNFWMGQCEYISKLLSPTKFIEKNTYAVDKIFFPERVKGRNVNNNNDNKNNNNNKNNHDGTTKTTTMMPANQLAPIYLESNGVYLDQADWVMGKTRWSYEHWVGSHPSIRPCDVSKHSSMYTWFKYNGRISDDTSKGYNQSVGLPQAPPQRRLSSSSSSEKPPRNNKHDLRLKWSMAPRHPLTSTPRFQMNLGAVQNLVHSLNGKNETNRIREWFFLGGRIYRWYELFGTEQDSGTDTGTNDNIDSSSCCVPSDDSWIWDEFPDGTFWKAAIQYYGIQNVVREVTYKSKIVSSMEEWYEYKNLILSTKKKSIKIKK